MRGRDQLGVRHRRFFVHRWGGSPQLAQFPVELPGQLVSSVQARVSGVDDARGTVDERLALDFRFGGDAH